MSDIKMWQCRNLVVQLVDTQEMGIENMWANIEIIAEFLMGQEPLSRRISHLFTVEIVTLLEKILHDKM